MEKRFYFVIGDLAANGLMGCLATAVSSWLIGGSLGMIPGMLVGMVLGAAVSLPLSLTLLVPVLGVIEAITPAMVTGMIAGMWGGMWPLQGNEILAWGIGSGLAGFVIIYSLNAILTGPRPVEE